MNPAKRGRQKLGQHFLTDSSVIEKIIASAEITKSDDILEIGPGKGSMTFQLGIDGKSITLIEADPYLAGKLEKRLPAAVMIKGRAEKVDLSTLPAPLVVVSNLPYFVAVHIFQHLTRSKDRISRMVLMFQKEVAERIAATNGNSGYGSLSLYSRYHWEIETVIEAGPVSFSPPPKVKSLVLKFLPRKAPPVAGDETELFRLIRVAFSQKRKTLRNNLKTVYTLASVEKVLENCKLNEKVRAEELSLEEFAKILPALELKKNYREEPSE
jgi:16S rRNA (adenine1518-N6/adenine1519-N6)-dimethyltransferase